MTGSLAAAVTYAAVVVAAVGWIAAADRHALRHLFAYAGLAGFAAGTSLAWATWVLPRIGPGALPATEDLVSVVARAVGSSIPLSLAGIAALSVLAGREGIVGPIDGTLAGTALGVGAGVGMTAVLDGRLPVPIWEASGWPLSVAATWGVVLGLVVGELRLEGRTLRRWGLTAGGVLASSLLAAVLAAAPTLPAPAQLWHGPLGRWLPLAWLACAAALAGVGARVERRVIIAELTEEAEHGVLPEPLVRLSASWSRRVRRAWWPRTDERREINRMLTALAFRKHRWRQLPEETARVYGLELGRLRERVRAVLNPRRGDRTGDDE